MVRIRTFGGLSVLCGALAGFAAPSWGQVPDPAVELLAIIEAPDEIAAPPDHLMASACFAELKVVYPDERHAFSNPVFTQSKILGEVVRVDYRVGETPNSAAANPEATNRLICHRHAEDAKLEMYTIRGITGPADELGPIMIVPQERRNTAPAHLLGPVLIVP
jgi:hypothetical protein